MILIYSAFLSERLKYILDEVFVNRLDIDYKHTSSMDYFSASQTFKLNYNNEISEGCVNIPATNFLYEEDLFIQNIEVEKSTEWTSLFFQQPYKEIPDFKLTTKFLSFDIFAAMFYLLSRYEEYLPSDKDEHNRYKETNCLAYKNDFLEIPLIDFWILRLKEILKNQYPLINFKAPVFKQVNSIDVDFAYKYIGLSAVRLGAKAIGSLWRGKWDQQTLETPEHDPYDTYEQMIQMAAVNKVETIFFFLLADYGGFDKGHSPDSPIFIKLIKHLSEHFICGIHPSYKSFVQETLLEKELSLFHSLTSRKATISRNHFLKIKLPETYSQLCKFNIEKDYSMGYSNHAGFRASTSFPFRFFNLITNKETALWIQPVCVMDVTLKNAWNMDPATAINKIHELKNTVKSVDGEFVSIWHNSSFDEEEGWLGWDKVYESLFN
ncbi:MAG: polysaccharide deacetylase family protein [Bacteroidia bacterium]|nr:polysaccharide deacetylase family protein [Bacteroidia bacterium]